MSDSWSVVESPFRIERAKAYEGLFTLGSGYLHVRGSLEQHLGDAPQNTSYTRLPANVTSEKFPDTKVKWGTYVPGVFGRHPLLGAEMINLPWFLGIVPVVDEERLDLETSRILSYRRTLDLRSATIMQSLRWRTTSGKLIAIEFERFIDAVHRHLCFQRMRLTAEREAAITLRCGIDADVRTNGYDHLTDVAVARMSDDRLECRVRTDMGHLVHLASCVRGVESPWRWESGPRRGELVTDLAAPGGNEILLEKRSAVATSRDVEATEATALLAEVEATSYQKLHEEHAAAWQRRWERCDVVIEGNEASQLAMRVALFHLLRAHVPGDPQVAIDAKGYAGEAYWGRFFWDTEMFLLPFYLYTDPGRARTLVDFRVQSLDGARANAARYGYAGARYAWESDSEGNECCPNWQYADHEVHVTADVVYGLEHYARAVEEDHLRGPAATVVVETARYWLNRLDRRAGDAGLSLLGVMGPDEYTPISSNNSFTNKMVARALALAGAIGDAGGATHRECQRFAEAAGALSEIRDERRGLVLQCEEFESLAEPDFEKWWQDRSKTLAAQVAQERLYRSKCLKQADVLMLMMLFPVDYDAREVRRAWDYYLPYTTHDSSLSAGVHAIVASRLGLLDEAWRFWQQGSRLDLDVERGGAAEGIHIANAGLTWQMAVLGFAGMRTAMQADALTLSPKLPRAWSRLAFPIVWKGKPAKVDITKQTVTVANHGTDRLTVRVYGDERVLDPEEQRTWATPE
ncbi:MAG: glycoside hydrolase family 65 protein [bacterium]|nr:glycoside hydrolase family 65 protein [bacterium]